MSREIIQQALEALLHMCNTTKAQNDYNAKIVDKALVALEAALAQPEQDHGFDRTASHMAGEYVDTAQLKAMHEACIEASMRNTQPEQEQEQEPEIVRRVRRYAGKRRESVSSPHINAKECIALANWIESKLKENNNGSV